MVRQQTNRKGGGLQEEAGGFTFTSDRLFFMSISKTKVELNEANEEAPHLAVLV